MDTLRWVVGSTLLLLSAWIAVMNAYVVWVDLRGDESVPLKIPLVGGLLGVLGLWALPVAIGAIWMWIPLVLDAGCLPALLFTAYYFLLGPGRRTADESPSKPTLITPTAGENGMTALHQAAYQNDPDAVRAELQRGIQVDIRDDGGWTPMHWSIDMSEAWGQPEEVVALLLEGGASANCVDNTGRSLLMMACDRGNAAILEQLIGAGADVHQRSVDSTPLHEAAGCNFSEGIQRLLSLGADPWHLDSNGCTPEQVATENGFDAAAAMFRTYAT